MGQEREETVERGAPGTARGGGLELRQSVAPPAMLSAQAQFLLSLQRSAGNRAVSGLVQRMREESAGAGRLEGGVAAVQRLMTADQFIAKSRGPLWSASISMSRAYRTPMKRSSNSSRTVASPATTSVITCMGRI